MKSWLKYGAIILIIVLFIVAFFIERKKEETTNKEQKPITISSSQLNKNTSKNKEKETDSDNPTATTEVIVDEEAVTEAPKLETDSFNYDKTYSETFGKEAVKEGRNLARNIIKVYVNNMKDIDKYKNQIKDSLYINMMRDKVDDDGVQRIVKVGKSTLLPNQKNGIAFEIEVSWDLKNKNNGVVTKGRDSLVYVNLIRKDDTWIVESMRFV